MAIHAKVHFSAFRKRNRRENRAYTKFSEELTMKKRSFQHRVHRGGTWRTQRGREEIERNREQKRENTERERQKGREKTGD